MRDDCAYKTMRGGSRGKKGVKMEKPRGKGRR